MQPCCFITSLEGDAITGTTNGMVLIYHLSYKGISCFPRSDWSDNFRQSGSNNSSFLRCLCTASSSGSKLQAFRLKPPVQFYCNCNNTHGRYLGKLPIKILIPHHLPLQPFRWPASCPGVRLHHMMEKCGPDFIRCSPRPPRSGEQKCRSNWDHISLWHTSSLSAPPVTCSQPLAIRPLPHRKKSQTPDEIIFSFFQTKTTRRVG